MSIGKDKGKKGKIEKIFPKDNTLLINGVNVYKRHVKRKDESNQGGIIDVTKPISAAKVALLCPSCHVATRVGFLKAKNEKVRICRKCDQKI